jgi:YVTN family beta-propeller protein
MFETRGSRVWTAAIAVALLIFVVFMTSIGAASARPSTAPVGGAVPNVALISAHYTIGLGKRPSGGAYDSKNFDVYISAANSNNVTVINSVGHTHSSISVGKAPDGVIYDPDNGNIYVLNHNSSSVSIINGATNKVSTTVSLGKGAQPINGIFYPATGGIFVVNNSSGKSTVVWLIANTTNKVTSLTISGFVSAAIAYSPTTKEIYMTDESTLSFVAVTPTGSVKTIPVSFVPTGVYYNPASADLLVFGINITNPHEPAMIAVVNSADKVVKTDTDATLNFVITPVVLISTGVGTGYNPSNKDCYFAGYNFTKNTSYVVVVSSSNAILATTLLGKGLSVGFGFYDPANKDMYFGSLGQGTGVFVVKGTKVAATIKTSQPILFFTYDPTLKDMFGAGYPKSGNSTLYALNSLNKVATSFTVGKEAVAFLYDPKDTYVYVANIGSNNVELVG